MGGGSGSGGLAHGVVEEVGVDGFNLGLPNEMEIGLDILCRDTKGTQEKKNDRRVSGW